MGTPLSGVLNILGMTVAFAALYIILVQVHHDLTYNKEVKDADRIYCVSLPDWYTEGKYMVWLNRPPFEQMITSISEIEAGGTGYLSGQAMETIVGDGKNPTLSDPSVSIKLSSMNKGTLDVFGFELAEGSWDNYVGVWDYAFSESAARKYGVGVGGHIRSRRTYNDKGLAVRNLSRCECRGDLQGYAGELRPFQFRGYVPDRRPIHKQLERMELSLLLQGQGRSVQGRP